MKANTELANKLQNTLNALNAPLRVVLGRKQPKRNAFEVTFHATNPTSLQNDILAELRASGGKSGALLASLRSEFSIIEFKWGCADLTACFVVGF